MRPISWKLLAQLYLSRDFVDDQLRWRRCGRELGVAPANRTSITTGVSGSVTTLADLRGVTPWLWIICERCQHRAPTALAPWIIHWGAEATGDMLRRSARCTECGGKGATIQIPGWGGVGGASARVTGFPG